MANKQLFGSFRGKRAAKTDATNREGSPAYAYTPKHKLAQYASTGCLNDTFYANAETQLEEVLELAAGVEAEFLAKAAVYTRQKGFMKDMPALLLAVLSMRDSALFARAFDRVIDNARMLRTFVQIVRSGAVGRKSLGSAPKRMILEWLEKQSDRNIFFSSIGNAPSLADVIRMVHPKPASESREALYGYLLGGEYNAEALPEIVQEYERFKAESGGEVPKVPMQMLTSMKLSTLQWQSLAVNATWQQLRMNLVAFARHNIFGNLDSATWNGSRMSDLVASRLRDGKEISRARVLPYQLLSAYVMSQGKVPYVVSEALQDAMEIATRNVPRITGKVYVMVDVSGSMAMPVTGYRGIGSTTAVRCVDVAALMASSILRTNRDAEVIPFDHDVVNMNLNPRDSVMTNAQKLANKCGGGTNCSAPLAKLNKRKASGDLVIYVSDNESWVDASRGWNTGTALMKEWKVFRGRNLNARMVCIDIQPYGTSQAKEGHEILNVGGFSDQVFKVVAAFARGELAGEHWVGEIEKVEV